MLRAPVSVISRRMTDLRRRALLLLILSFLSTVHKADGADCPAACDPSKCPTLDCESDDFVADLCGCCLVCSRPVDGVCGGTSGAAGICRSGLRCDLDPKEATGVGRCVVMWPERCLKAKCDVVFQPKCSDDSKLVVPPLKPDECCQSAGECKCDLEKCNALAPVCRRGFERVRMAVGSRKPGDCCDTFECKARELHCENVKCPPDLEAQEPCPADSARPPSYVPRGSCCQVTESCRCKPGICPPAHCPAPNSVVNITSKGDGTAGNCCDRFECSPLQSDHAPADAVDVKEEESLPNKRPPAMTMSLTPTSESKGCPYKGETFAEGQIWYPESRCEECKCKAGVAFCKKMTCASPPSRCSWVGIPDGECCPVCLGCRTDAGDKMKQNDTWNKDDCTTCTCGADGEPQCQRHMCQVQCDNPRKVPGQCCPVCDEPTILTLPSVCPSLEHCPLRCEYGLQRDDRGCFQCVCMEGTDPEHSAQHSVGCESLNEENCEKQCAHGYLRDGNDCAVCKCDKCPPLHQCYKHCLYGFESNVYGCPLCKCRTSLAQVGSDASPTGQHGSGSAVQPQEGQDKCVSLTGKGAIVQRDSSEWWNDGCRHCYCEHGQEFCSLISCPDRPDDCPVDNWQLGNGDCCPSCKEQSTSGNALSKHAHTVCQSPGTGRLYVDGETWQLAPCVSCTCRVGHVLCHVAACPPIACEHPVFDLDDRCCPICPDQPEPVRILSKEGEGSVEPYVCTDEDGLAHVEDSSWRVDECTSCICKRDLGVQCYRESCPPSADCKGLPLLLKGRCCPVCSDQLGAEGVCEYKKNMYGVKELWKDGACRNCTCNQGGQTLCTEFECPPCSSPIYLKGQCCPACKDTSTGWFSIGNSNVYEPPVNLMLLGACVGMFIVIVAAIVLICWLMRRTRRHRDIKRPPKFCKDAATNGSVILASKAVGSTAILPTKSSEQSRKRLSSGCDGQSESLLSTTSESSAATSTGSSGGHQAAFDTATLPLTGKHSTSSNQHRPMSLDLGIGKFTRSIGSFRKKTTPQKLAKHLSCHV